MAKATAKTSATVRDITVAAKRIVKVKVFPTTEISRESLSYNDEFREAITEWALDKIDWTELLNPTSSRK